MSSEIQSPFHNRVVVVAIEHDESRVYLLHGETARPQSVIRRGESRLLHVRGGQERHLHSTEGGGQEYFAALAEEIESASHVVLFGHGHGNSNSMNGFIEYVNTHNRSLRDRCIRGERIDFSSVTDGQLLAMAKKLWEVQ